jgi:hypothetical protein
MLNEATLEKRLATLERTVSDLQHKLESKPPSEDWVDKLVGSVSDEAAFLEALDYGRLARQADKPLDESNEQL